MHLGGRLVNLPNKFVHFSNFVGMLVAGFEKEINSLLKNLEVKKWRGVKISGGKRNHLSTFVLRGNYVNLSAQLITTVFRSLLEERGGTMGV